MSETVPTVTLDKRPPVPGVSLSRVVISEWTKFRSLRSTYWSLIAAAILMIGLGALFCLGTASQAKGDQPDRIGVVDPVSTSITGFILAQFAIGVLGVLCITGEYSTGMIRATLAAVPKRLPVLWAKLIVFAVVGFVVMLVTSLIAFFIGQAVLASADLQVTIGSPGALRAVVGCALYLTVVGLFGIGLGGIIRSSAGSIAALVVLLLIIPILANFLPSSWAEHINKYLPGNAGQGIMNTIPNDAALSPWVGFGVFCGYVVVVVAIAAVLLKRRDA